MNPRVIIKRGKEKPILAHHPWIFSGAVARVMDAQDGDTVDVFDAEERWIARGYYNSHSQILVRLWTWDRDEPADRALLWKRLESARALRERLIDARATNVYRLVNAESDWLPGLVVDCYADQVVVQFLTLGIERWKPEIVEWIARSLAPRGVYERSDVDVREKEGLAPLTGILLGAEPLERVQVRENGLHFWVDVKRGHKTGFYIDQRENRQRAAQFLSAMANRDEKVAILNVFSYSGAFGVYACRGDNQARVIQLDASQDALELARETMRLNAMEEKGEFVQGDAFQVLRRYRDEGRSFDAIILDPPKFVYAHSQLDSGLRGYKDINLLALKLLKPNGTLITFSCSGLVSADLFQKVIFGAAEDAGRQVQILAKLLQGPDHPILLASPESEYLKGLVCHVCDAPASSKGDRPASGKSAKRPSRQ